MKQKGLNYRLYEIFKLIAKLLEVKGDTVFKIRAYQNASRILKRIPEIEEYIKEDRLTDIEGVGDAISDKIKEFYHRGTISFFERLKNEFPPGVIEMAKLSGVGGKTIRKLWKEHGIDSIEKLEQFCLQGKLAQLKGFGKKIEEKFLEEIKKYKKQNMKFQE